MDFDHQAQASIGQRKGEHWRGVSFAWKESGGFFIFYFSTKNGSSNDYSRLEVENGENSKRANGWWVENDGTARFLAG